MPYISTPYREQSLLNGVRSAILQVPIADTSGRHIDLAPWPEFIDEKGIVHFNDNDRPEAERMRKKVIKPAVLVFATSYKQEFLFLDSNYITPGEADIRNVWKSGDESVGLMSFVRPSFGISNSFPSPRETSSLSNRKQVLSHQSPSSKPKYQFSPSLTASTHSPTKNKLLP
jgi:hypothetical protein